MKVRCKICGKEFERIDQNHLKKHGITTKEYKEKFSDAPLMSESYRKKKSEGQIGKPSPMKGKHQTEEAKQKLREVNLGKHPSEASKQKNREAHLGKPSGMKGKHQSEEAKQLIREANLGTHPSEATRQKLSEAQSGENNGFYGHEHTVETKQKQREAHLGKIPTSKMIEGHKRAGEKLLGTHPTEEAKQHISDNHADFRGEKSGMYGREAWSNGETKETNETLKIISEKMLKNWQDPEFIKKMVNSWYRSGQTRPEKDIDSIVQLIYPNEYKFNGNFELGITIGGKIPDFVNVNGKKKAIDMFGDWCHRDDDPQVRIDLFKEYGWDLLVIWEHELKDRDAVIQKIVEFHGVKSDYVLTQKTLDVWVDGEDKDENK